MLFHILHPHIIHNPPFINLKIFAGVLFNFV